MCFMMKKVYCVLQILLLLATIPIGWSTSWLCGRTQTMELGGGAGAGAALALTLVRPSSAESDPTAPPPPCKLRLAAPNAAAFLVRLIDVKESLLDAESGSPLLSALGGAMTAAAARKWSSRSAAAPEQDTAGREAAAPAPGHNKTEPCTLSVYIAESPTAVWRLHACGARAASVAARAGTKLLPPRIKLVWTPPASPNHRTDKLRLVVTAVYSGSDCNSTAQLWCGALGLCVSASLACDGVRHCPGGEDEEAGACARRRDPPLLGLLRRLAATDQELLGIEAPDAVTKPSVIMKIDETKQKTSTLAELTEALKPYGPWGYIMMGVLMCATMIMFVIVWECCCSRSKPDEESGTDVPAACLDLAPALNVAVTSSSTTPPAYEPPPTYSSLFPRAFKSSPTPVPHCSHEPPPD